MDLEKIAKIINVPAEAVNLLTKPEREVSLAVSLRVSENKLVQTDAYVCFYNTVRGPAKGGIRFHPDVTLVETRKLAELMVWKTALVGIPFGGGKTGLAVDPRQLTRAEKTALIKELVHLIRHELMFGDYIPAPDMGTDARDMATIFGETHSLESVTGKPPRVGGLPGREEATGRGVAQSTKLLARRYSLEPKNTTVAIQGFGNVGSWAAYFLYEQGFKVIAVSDISAAIYNPDGFDVSVLKDNYSVRGASLAEAHRGEKIERESLLELPVDILIPAATGGAINRKNADKIQAKYIVEAANNPITEQAEPILLDAGKIILPDILANAGGVIASYVEWRKARSGSLTPREETYNVIDSVIESAFNNVIQAADEFNVDYRMAANIQAVREVVSTMEDRGWL